MNENVFSYTYSATCNQEVLNIRRKYLPREETKLEEQKQNAAGRQGGQSLSQGGFDAY